MKNTIMILAAAIVMGSSGLVMAQPDATSSRSGAQQQQAEQDLRDAAGAPSQQQQRELQRPPAPVPPEQQAAPGERNIPLEQPATRGGGAGLIIGGIFLALIVFVLFRRGRRSETGPQNKP